MTRPLRRAVAKRIFNFPENWDHATAQRYEIAAARGFVLEAFPRNYAHWEAQPADFIYYSVDDQFFCGDTELFAQFKRHIPNRRCLEIGSGPFGHLGQSKGLRNRVIVDPLIDAYRDIELREFGKTFFTPDIQTHAVSAETRIESLLDSIDGLIVCRNCLDHCDDPLLVLQNISDYAATGCWVFLWSDIWHLHEPDAGHRNITRSPRVMETILNGLRLPIVRMGRAIGNPVDCVEFGCISRKVA